MPMQCHAASVFCRKPQNFYKNLVIHTDMMYNKEVSGENAGIFTGSLSKF